MTDTQEKGTSRPPLRLWPGVTIVVLQWLTWLAVPALWPELGLVGVAGVALGGLAVIVWWTFFSRAPWSERIGALLLIVVAVVATRPLLHESLATAGLGVLFFIYAIPALSLALVLWAVASERLSFSAGARRAALVVIVLLACGMWTLVRTGGVTGAGDSQFAWRWSPTPEERLLARTGGSGTLASTSTAPPAAPAPEKEPEDNREPEPDADAAANADDEANAGDDADGDDEADPGMDTGAGWPGFRGSRRDGVVHGVSIETDWEASPPVELWRRPVGPGWSSFAVRGSLIYTQEQRGEEELVSAYDVSTGEPVWQHRDETRFWESNGGPGPRATPTVAGDRVYAFGATGLLNVLDARDGGVVWSRNVADDVGKETPYWGFASSPLVFDDRVVVAAAGQLAAYDRETGAARWTGPDGGQGYSSPHLARIDGVPQVVLLGGTGAMSVDPADGTLLWEHAWPGAPIVQPALTADGDVLVNTVEAASGAGIRRLEVDRGEDGQGEWSLEQLWMSRGLKPYFNDFVVHEGHGYGFDGSILSCIDLETGERAWKGGRYGHGQLVLLADQDVLLVISEDGDLALVSATPEGHAELAKVPALDGKTWNHPVVVDDLLLVRNGQEMVAFRLSPAD